MAAEKPLGQPDGVRAMLGSVAWPRTLTLVCAGTLALLGLWGWEGYLPLVVVPFLVGIALGCCLETRAEALLAGLVAGFTGTAAAAWVYQPDRLSAVISSIPPWMNQDVAVQTYQLAVIGAWRDSASVSAYLRHSSISPMIVVGTMLVPAFALAAVELRRHKSAGWLARALPWAVALAVAAALVLTLAQADAPWFAFLDYGLRPGSYNTDLTDNLRTLQIMQNEGKDYYAASVESAAGDMRYGPAIQAAGGKLTGGSAAMVRQPATFYLWRFITTFREADSSIGWASVFLAALLMPLSYWGLRGAIGERALFVGFALFPGFAMWAAAPSILEPEWWALLVLLAAFFTLACGRTLPSLLLAFTAVLIRETTGAWLLCQGVAALVLTRQDRDWARVAIAAAGLLTAAIVAFLVHARAASPYFVPSASKGALGAYLASRHARSFTDRALAPLSYLMLPYGLNAFGPWLLAPFGILGLWVGLRRVAAARLATTFYLAVMIAFFVLFGATATYWGQIVNPFVIVGVALLVLSLDQLGERSTWTLG